MALRPFEELSWTAQRYARDTKVLPPGYAPPKDHRETLWCRCFMCDDRRPVFFSGTAGMVDD